MTETEINDPTRDSSVPSLKINQETMDVLVAHVIPTSKYFEVRFDHMQHQVDDFKIGVDRRFDHMQHQIDDVKETIRDFKSDVDKRFEQVDKRFEQVDKRFEQVDKRFEQVDIRLQQIIGSIDKLGDKLDNRDRDQRGFTMRMFTIAISISILGAIGVFLKALGII
jgi:hypothetical protein